MTIPSGSRLGPYEVGEPLGSGGMGEVYRARDTRLDREVAVKVLPAHLSADPQLRQRFEREARAASALNHSHICALYDVGEAVVPREGEAGATAGAAGRSAPGFAEDAPVQYLVMELLAGETLADRLAKGPLPAEKVLEYGRQIAEALAEAHRHGVVHRDLKPGNVMLTRSGVKVLDFGLAKVAASGAVALETGFTHLATEARPGEPLTQEGTILGTFHYMAPEQLEGGEADARSDIWALGAVLYEMATGRRAFEGQGRASLIASIMSAQPPAVSTIQPMAPPALDHVIRRCLAKDSEDRWQSAHDLATELAWVAEAGSRVGVPAPVVARRKVRERVAWGLAALFATAAALATIGYLGRAPAEPRLLRASILVPEGFGLDFPALSPDGSRLAFVGYPPEGKSQIWLRDLGELEPRPLPGTEDATLPFWSPDGRSIAFFSELKLRRVDVAGGPPVNLAGLPTAGAGGSWSAAGFLLVGQVSGPILRIPAAGGAGEPVTELDPSSGETSHRYPFLLPDGRHFLYLAGLPGGTPSDPVNRILVADLESGDVKPLVTAPSNAAYAAGHLLFGRDGNLFAQAFDLEGLAVRGELLPVVERVAGWQLYWGLSDFSASRTGTLVYEPWAPTPLRLAWVDRAGRDLAAAGKPDFYEGWVRISPDGRKAIMEIRDPTAGTTDLWLHDFATDIRTRFTSGPRNNVQAVWSPDGSRILFATDRKNQADLYVKPVSGGAEEVLLEGEGQRFPNDWSPDGKFLLVEDREPRGQRNVSLSVLELDGGDPPRPLVQRKTTPGNARFSPDGRWLAYSSDESGQWEVYVTPFPGPGGRWQVSAGGGGLPVWAPDGREIVYRGLDGRIFSVAVTTTPSSFESSAPRLLFEPRDRIEGFDLHPDGERLLLVLAGERASSTLTLVENWSAGLRR